jgi:spectinomycin phosphotransferase
VFINRKTAINRILARTDELIRQIKKMEIKYCLCHGDIHAANILISDDNNFFIVDWDTLILAPKERDLMFIGGGIAGKWNVKEEEKLFYKGYGAYDDVNKILLAYYRYYRIIEDIAVYCDQFFEENIQEENQKVIIERIDSNFWPGNTVDMASSLSDL